MRPYKHIFFDLDRTLWDYEANVQEAFQNIFEEFGLFTHIADIALFINRFHHHNELLWTSYRQGMIRKDFLRNERFNKTLGEFGVHDHVLARKIGQRYLEITPSKTHVLPGTFESLNYLRNNKYQLHVLTNGFRTVQMQKLSASGLATYFTRVITSDDVRHQKPHREIFAYALKINNARKTDSIMIGDDWDVDIMGAYRFGIDQIYFNPDRYPLSGNFEPTYEIRSLNELKEVFIE